jgi:hypothetical protein
LATIRRGCGQDFEEDVAFFDRLLGFPPRKGMLEPVDGRATRQRLILFPRIAADDGLKERIVPQQLRVVAVGVAGQDLIDLLRENPLRRMHDEQLIAGVRQPPSGFGQDAEFQIELANRQQPGVADHIAAVEGHGDLLPPDFKKLQLPSTLCLMHRTPPVLKKLNLYNNLSKRPEVFYPTLDRFSS